jgi:hypothetical protein
MDKKPEWIQIDPIHFRCPVCEAVREITRPSGKDSERQWRKYLDGKLLEHLDEHKRRDDGLVTGSAHHLPWTG